MIVINSGQAAAVQLIFSYYLEGKSLREIKEALEAAGIPSPQNKQIWGKQTLANILTNPHYLPPNDICWFLSERKREQKLCDELLNCHINYIYKHAE